MLDNILAALPRGADVNNAGDVRGLLDGLRELLDTGITVVAVHHPAKGGPNGPARSPLGSRAIEAHFRSLLRLEKGRSGHVLHVSGNETPELQLPLQLRESEGMRFALAADKGPKEPAGIGRRNRRQESYDRNLEMARAILRSGQTTSKSQAGRFLHERAYAGTAESGRTKVRDLLRAGLLAEENGRLIAGPSLSGPPAAL